MNLENYSLTGKTGLITGGAGMLGVQHAAVILEVEWRTQMSTDLHYNTYAQMHLRI